jgi:bacterioferritin-associated ferredoxin
VRPFLDALYRPADWVMTPAAADTLVCRCEEVTAGAVRAALAEGCASAAEVKAFTRCGMGPCQGRMCQPTLCRMIAAARRCDPGDVPPARPRFPVKPVTLAALAALADDGEGPGAPDWM